MEDSFGFESGFQATLVPGHRGAEVPEGISVGGGELAGAPSRHQ